MEEEEIIIPEETINYDLMRYELDELGYILNVYFGCYTGTCVGYEGDIPSGYETLVDWHDEQVIENKLNAWKIVDGNLVFDEVKYNELEVKCAIEEEENAVATRKYVNDKVKVSSNYVTDELAVEKTGSSLMVIDDTGNYNIPELKVTSDVIDKCKVISSNKNILGIETISNKINGVTITNNGDGTITLNGTSTDVIEVDINGSNTNIEMLYLIDENKEYGISGLTENVSLSLHSYNGIDRTFVINSDNGNINLTSSFRVTQTTLNIPSGVTFNKVVISPQIELGSVTSFIKHEETSAIGILDDNECIIDSLNSYEEKTIIMIDKEVVTSVKYYKYQYLNEKLAEIEVTEEEVRSTLVEINETVDGQNQKISEVSQRVGELNSKISEVADTTTSRESIYGNVTLEGINESEPIYIKVHPTSENISYLYPRENLYPRNNLFIKTRTLRFKNTETKEVIDYELPNDLLFYDENNYDEFILDYELQSCSINKKVGYNPDGTTYLLETPKIIEYKHPKIQLTNGDYEVSLVGYNNGYIFVRMMAQNIYTSQFVTIAKHNSDIKQTSEEISLSVDKKLEGYSTIEETSAAIKVESDNISSEVKKKVGKSEVVSSINQSSEAVSINANRISLSGKTLNLADNMAIKSNKFNVDSNGNMTCSNANITGGKINITGSNYSSDDVFNIRLDANDNSNNRVYIQPGGMGIIGESGYRVDIQAERENQASMISVYGSSGSTEIIGNTITTGTVNQTSKEELKKNFEKFENALDVIKNIDIYKYNLKDEKDGTKKHIGFVIGDNYKYAKEVTSNNNDGVDIYSFVSLCCKAIKEQQILIDGLNEEIKSLKEGDK